MSSKDRLDKILVTQNLCRSRSQARELIQQGLVEARQGARWVKQSRASYNLPAETELRILENSLQKYVSRAALKLLGALEKVSFDPSTLRAIDIGQSTGGFTQVLLEKGASQVVGIEVGHGQLVAEIRNDPRVICLEGVNGKQLATAISEHRLKTGFDLAVMDVSFISQTLIIPEISKLINPQGILLSLVKPQFEVGRDGIGKGGLVTDKSLYKKVEEKIGGCCEQNGFEVLDYFPSSIDGADGNQEFFIFARYN